MAQCQGKTRKGERCKRDALEDSAFCSVHEPEENVTDEANGNDNDAPEPETDDAPEVDTSTLEERKAMAAEERAERQEIRNAISPPVR